MKKIFNFIVLICISTFVFSQKNDTPNELIQKDDTVYIDTLNRNIIGLNIYPALGIFGSGRIPSAKIALQYKHMFDNINIRSSLNYINENKTNQMIDIVGTTTDQVIKDNDTILVDSAILRQYLYNIYTYDARIGVEASFPRKNYKFYVGGGLIGGYHFIGEYYYHYKTEFSGYPTNFKQYTIFDKYRIGSRETGFVKMGIDFNIGVDINIASNCVLSIQYAPEIAYYQSISESVTDPYKYYKDKIKSDFSFKPDYIDIFVYIRF